MIENNTQNELMSHMIHVSENVNLKNLTREENAKTLLPMRRQRIDRNELEIGAIFVFWRENSRLRV